MNNNNYMIESSNESRRLDFQSQIEAYNMEEELKAFDFTQTDLTLDAGCGNGHLINKLIQKDIKTIHALDFSEERLNEIKNAHKNKVDNKEIVLIHADITDTKIKDNTYDRIISRYVYEHLLDPEAAIKEMYRILKYGGEYNIINFDDIFFGLETKNKWLNQRLLKFKQDLPYDFNIAKKLPHLLKKYHFDSVSWQAHTFFFKGKDQLLEKENARMRLEQARKSFLSFFNSPAEYDQFVENYLAEFDDDCSVIYTTKFLIKAIK